MQREEILSKLKQTIIDELYLEDITYDDLAEDISLFGEGIGLDSIDAVELVVIVEKHFNVTIKDSEEAKTAFSSLGVLASFIQQRM